MIRIRVRGEFWSRQVEISLLRLMKDSNDWVTYRLIAFEIPCIRRSLPPRVGALNGLDICMLVHTRGNGASKRGELPGCSHCKVLLKMGVSRR